MTTVIIPGAPVARPGPVREVLPRPPSLTYSGMRTRAYRDWYRKYGSLDNYRAYKRTRIYRAGGARHGRGDDYKYEVEKDPFGTALEDFGRWGVNTTWGLRKRSSSYIPPGTVIRSNAPDRAQYGGDYNKDIIWHGDHFEYYYDNDAKHNSTGQFDWKHENMLSKGDYQNRLKHKWNYKANMYHKRHRNDMPVGYYKPKPRPRFKRMRINPRYRSRFRPKFFNKDDHY